MEQALNQTGKSYIVRLATPDLVARDENSIAFCQPEDPQGYNCQTYTLQTTVDVPPTFNCPGCDDLPVFYKVRICQNPIPPYNKVVSFFDFNATYCPEVRECWAGLPDGILAAAMDAFNYAASVSAENQFMIGGFNGGFFNADCDNGQQVVASFIRQSCYQVCEIALLEYPYASYSTMPCGVKCCIRTTSYCEEEDGEIRISEPSFTQTGSGGDCFTRAWPECQGNIISCYDAPCGPQ